MPKHQKLLFEKLLQESDLKKTEFRLRLLKLLQTSAKPLSAQEILLRMRLKLKAADKVTLYRNLEVFEQKGLTCRMYFIGQEALYELRSDENHHHHLICTQCQKVEDVPSCGVGLPHTESGFVTKHHHLEFYGLCKGCQ